MQNVMPGCVAVFVDAPNGALAFRIRAASGRYRSGEIQLLAHHGHIKINRAWLEDQLETRGGPTG
ncbi:MAG: hypothetical protein GC159_15115 [Phycisphaera sp.]|nr:hypothetical protein [Phycisphaera sp.]